MHGLTLNEQSIVSDLRGKYLICRPCKVRVTDAGANDTCPQCGGGLRQPNSAFQQSYPTVKATAAGFERSAPPAPVPPIPPAWKRGRCIYCQADGQEVCGDGLRKRCSDEVACAARVRAAREATTPSAGRVPGPRRGERTGSPAQALIDMMQRSCELLGTTGPFVYSDELRLPLVAAQARNVLFGKPGCGKTHTDAIIAENCYLNTVPLSLLDKLGNMWGLRGAGTGPGLPIPILGGLRGDLPIAAYHGAVIASIFAKGYSAIVDVSLLSPEEQQLFAADYFEELVRVLRIPSHVIVEEAEAFCPAFSRSKSHFAAQGAGTVFASQIRNFGVGWTFSTQKPKMLHSNVIDSSSAFIAMQTTGPDAQNAIRKEAKTRLGPVIADAILSELGQLGQGEAWLLPDPDWLGTGSSAPVRFRFRERQTYNSSAVPVIGQAPPSPPRLVEADLRPFKAALKGVTK